MIMLCLQTRKINTLHKEELCETRSGERERGKKKVNEERKSVCNRQKE